MNEVDTEDGNGAEWERHVGDDEEQERRDLGDVTGQRVRDRLLQVVEDQPTSTANKCTAARPVFTRATLC